MRGAQDDPEGADQPLPGGVFLALAGQIFLSFYQSGTVLRELDDQMGNFNAISRFQNGVEQSLSAMENYRWEYGDAKALTEELNRAFLLPTRGSGAFRATLAPSARSSICSTTPSPPPTAATPRWWASWKRLWPPARTRRLPSSTIIRSSPAEVICVNTPSSCSTGPSPTHRAPTPPCQPSAIESSGRRPSWWPSASRWAASWRFRSSTC